MKKFLPFIKKEFLQTMRDPRTRFILFIAPLIQLLVFGYVTTLDIKYIRVVVAPYDTSREMREMLYSLNAQGYITVIESYPDMARIDDFLRAGRADAGLILMGNRVMAIVDGTNAQIARTFIDLLNSYRWNKFGVELVRYKVHFNPRLISSIYMLPGVILLIIFVVVGILGAVAMTREKERGTYELLLMTPLSSGEIVVGKMLPYTIFGLFDVIIVALLAHFLLGMPLRGNVPALLPVLILYVWGIASLSVWISSYSSTQQQAMLSLFLFFLPFILLSGLFFPIESMPRFFQYIAELDPLTHILRILRGVFIRGDNPMGYPYGLIDLLTFALFFTYLAAKNVKRVLE